MPIEIPDFWPDSIGQAILTPLTILKAQASELTRRTGGLVRGEVITANVGEYLRIDFDIVAPLLNQSRDKVFEVTHSQKSVFPAAIRAKCFEDVGSESQGPFGPGAFHARTQEEFLEGIKLVIQSPETISLVQSIIAKSNEANWTPATNETRNPASPTNDK